MKNEMIIDTKFGDVTGDGTFDKVSLIGSHVDNIYSPAMKNFKILIQDGKTHLTYEIPIPNIIGYQPILSLYNFRNKQISDIFVSIVSGGSGDYGYFYIFGYDGIEFNKLFDSLMFNSLFKYQVKYLDDYRIEIIDNTLEKKYILDISSKDDKYLTQVYNEDGTLKSPTSGNVSELNQLFPVDTNNDGIFKLLAFQRVIGLYNADLLGYLQTLLSWQKDRFAIFYREQLFAQPGTDI